MLRGNARGMSSTSLTATASDVSRIDARRTVLRVGVAIVVSCATLAALGAVGRFFVFDGSIGDAEHDLVAWIAENRTGVLDPLATNGSTLADTWTVIGVMVGSIGMLLVTGHRRGAALIFSAVIIEFTTFLVVGYVIDRARPDVEVLHSLPSTSSFPSGHVAVTVALYGSLILISRSLHPRSTPAIWAVPFLFAIVVAASRVYEGVHYPTDVAAGFVLGVGSLVGAAVATGFAELDGLRVRPMREDDEHRSATCGR